MKPTLFVILGPTGVGKTELSLKIAQELSTSIISSDSRQIYQAMKIGTAAPTPEQLKLVNHFFIGQRPLDSTYSAGQYEEEALPIIAQEIKQHNAALLVGGSMLYIDAVCKGMDQIPTTDPEVRALVQEEYAKGDDDKMRGILKMVDPELYKSIDLKNMKRVLHALEVYYQNGIPLSQLQTGQIKNRPFSIVKIGLDRPRAELFERINQRVALMMEEGLEQEARTLYPFKDYNALNTVGYKELFNYFDGVWDKETAIQKIGRNTRWYAKKQLTWFKKDESIHWFHPKEEDAILNFIKQTK